jgi:nucleoside-diphosphate-sugar epimerase
MDTPRSYYAHELKEGCMPRSVVTGVAGFIGSHLAEHLIDLGHEVVGIDCFTPYYRPRLKRTNLAALMPKPRFQLVDGALSAVDLGPVLGGADDMFHQAAQAGVMGTAINSGGSRVVLRDMHDVLREAVGQRAQLGYMAHQTGDAEHTAADCRRAQRLLGFVPAVDIVEGLHRQVAWQLGAGTTPRQEGGRLAAAV